MSKPSQPPIDPPYQPTVPGGLDDLDIRPKAMTPEEGGGFQWPTPPFASYPKARPQVEPLACDIEGLTGKSMPGRLIFFVPESTVAHVQVPPARTTMQLRFSQFRSIVLKDLLHVTPATGADPHARLLNSRTRFGFRVLLVTGSQLEGQTVGHLETEYGLFLFQPVNEQDSVRRIFLPREAYVSYEVGPRIGEVLVADKAATSEQVEQIAQEQQKMRAQKIGEILLVNHIVQPDQLLAAIDQQSKMPVVRIGEALIAMNIISDTQLSTALEQQKRDRSVALGELLVRSGMVSRDQLQGALARKMGYPLVDLKHFPVELEALRKVPFVMAERLKAMPLLLRDTTLIVALENPSQRLLIAELEFASQCKIVPVLAQHEYLARAIVDSYTKLGADTSVRAGAIDFNTPLELEPAGSNELVANLEREGHQREVEDRPIEQSDNSLVRLINTMIMEAHSQGVSDIHIESYPGREKIRIRFRKDGVLRAYLELPHNYRSAMLSRIKIMCDLDTSERRKPQDGKINFARYMPGHRIELRVATIPTNNGLEDVVLRILASAKPIPLDNLGFSAHNLGLIKEAMERPYGLVLCVGPTGSGKTTTLHSALSYINVPERKIWTAEDPVEITQPGLRQVQVNPKIDWTFAKALRAFLRADPDVIMVGEVRDEETANMAVEASLTGHLVLSTLHTNSAPETVTRLLDMGMDPFNFADSLLLVLAQRLVRRLCKNCRSTEPATPEYLEELLGDYLRVCPPDLPDLDRTALLARWQRDYAVDGRLVSYRCRGCEACASTGYKGRAGLHELMKVTRDLRRLIQTGARAEELQQQGIREGMRTLRQDGIEKVLQGVTSIEEVRATSNL